MSSSNSSSCESAALRKDLRASTCASGWCYSSNCGQTAAVRIMHARLALQSASAVQCTTVQAMAYARHSTCLQNAMPTATIFAELPLLSEGKQGRALLTGQFTGNSTGDLLLDIVVQSPEGLLHAIEVNGKEHLTRARTILGDAKKREQCAELGFPLSELWLTKQGVPSGN